MIAKARSSNNSGQVWGGFEVSRLHTPRVKFMGKLACSHGTYIKLL